MYKPQDIEEDLVTQGFRFEPNSCLWTLSDDSVDVKIYKDNIEVVCHNPSSERVRIYTATTIIPSHSARVSEIVHQIEQVIKFRVAC